MPNKHTVFSTILINVSFIEFFLDPIHLLFAKFCSKDVVVNIIHLLFEVIKGDTRSGRRLFIDPRPQFISWLSKLTFHFLTWWRQVELAEKLINFISLDKAITVFICSFKLFIDLFDFPFS